MLHIHKIHKCNDWRNQSNKNHNLSPVKLKLQEVPVWIVALFCHRFLDLLKTNGNVLLYYTIKKVIMAWPYLLHTEYVTSCIVELLYHLPQYLLSMDDEEKPLFITIFFKIMLIIWEIYTKATIYSLFILFVIWTKPNINIHISFEDEALNRIACIYVRKCTR